MYNRNKLHFFFNNAIHTTTYYLLNTISKIPDDTGFLEKFDN